MNNRDILAFPVYPDQLAQPGMTLRDYFAAKAMQGLIAAGWDQTKPGDVAWTARLMADALLKELGYETQT